MGEKASFFVLRAKAVPEVLLRVVEAKRLLDSGKVESVQEATEMVPVSYTHLTLPTNREV